MSFKRFNRHEIFNAEMMQFHSATVRQVEDFFIENDLNMYNDLTNMLYGMWDGYLYTDLLQSAKGRALTATLIARIEKTIDFIMEKTHDFETI